MILSYWNSLRTGAVQGAERIALLLKSKKQFLPWVSFLAAVFLLLDETASLRGWILDDGLIFLRYVQNFLAGHGFVYNAGAPPVEGYTSFLWLIILTAAGYLHFDLVQTAIVLGHVFSIASLLLLTLSHKFSEILGWKVRFLAPLVVIATRTYAPWAGSGMEVSLFSFLTLLYFLNHIRLSTRDSIKNRDLFFQGVFAGLLLMTRPEGFLIAGLSFLDLSVVFGRQRKRFLFVWGAAVLTLYLPYFFWRYNYYGFLFPNTYYVKVGDGFDMLQRGLAYVRYFTLEYVSVIILLVLAPWTLRMSARKLRLGFLIGYVVVSMAYVAYVGGDYLGAFRFFAPMMPICALIASFSLEKIAGSGKLFFMIAMLLLPQQWYSSQNVHDHVLSTAFIARDGKLVGEWLKKTMPPDTTFATNSAGAIAYYSGLVTIDMLGLNDKHIAHSYIPYMGHGTAGHEKGNGPYVLLQKPDYIQFGPPLGRFTPELVGDAELERSPSFRLNYEEQAYRLPNGSTVKLFKRKDVVAPVPSVPIKKMEKAEL